MGIQVTINAHPLVNRGESLEVSVVVLNPTTTLVPVTGVLLRVCGRETFKVVTSRSTMLQRRSETREHRFVDVALVLSGPTRLRPGDTTYRATIPIPSDAPPSHETGPAFAELRVIATVQRRWLLLADWIASTFVTVRALAENPLVRVKDVAHSADGMLDVSLASRILALGEPIVGWVAQHGKKPVTLRVKLVAVTRCFRDNGGVFALPLVWRQRELEVPAGQARPFALPLLRTMAPSFTAATHQVMWLLVVETAKLVGNSDVELPLELVDPGAVPPTFALDAAPLDGALVGMLAALARWQLVPDELVDDRLGMIRPAARFTTGAVVAELGIAIEQRTYRLVARVRCSLGVDAVPRTALGSPIARTGVQLAWAVDLAAEPRQQIAELAVELARIAEVIAKATRPDDAPYR